MIALLLHTLPGLGTLQEVLAMPADLVMWLLDSYSNVMQRARESAGNARRVSDDGAWEDLGNGQKRYKIRSMDTLYAVMQTRGGVL